MHYISSANATLVREWFDKIIQLVSPTQVKVMELYATDRKQLERKHKFTLMTQPGLDKGPSKTGGRKMSKKNIKPENIKRC